MKIKQLAPLSDEFSNVELCDKRLKKRLMTIVDAAEKSPGASLPGQAGSSAALEGTYRFVENPRVSPESLLDAHVQHTVERAAHHPFVYVIHDTTEFKFSGQKRREDLGRLKSGKDQGFSDILLPVLLRPASRLVHWGCMLGEGKPKGRRSQQESQSNPNRESLRWIDSALQTGELLHNKTNAIHLMDREGDSYELFAFLLDSGECFVIRLSHDCRREGGRAEPKIPKLFEMLSNAPYLFEREVVLSERNNRKIGTKKATFPNRQKRLTWLEVRATQQEIFIGNGSSAHLPPSLRLNFVEVREPYPPEGEEPIMWRLVTTQPIEYRRRCGCNYRCVPEALDYRRIFQGIKNRLPLSATSIRKRQDTLGSIGYRNGSGVAHAFTSLVGS
ncbi:MAG: hypothetical protein D3924_04500 [Candidatus Electrothrix sp. AR4]|nr:hypothetical protein [Candidatus Electrothrix sp. AR4]